MQKSIKKVIAGAIAALMITSSIPFVASAAPGDYEPDVQLQFSTFCDDPSDATSTTSKNATAYAGSGLAGFPINWDQKTGTLTAKKEDINTYNSYYFEPEDPEDPEDVYEPVEEDWVLGEGDIFVATIRFDKVSEAASGNVNIRFSDNLTPAGLWQSGTGKNAKFSYADENSAPSKPKALVGFREPIADWSASTLYDGMNDTDLKDKSCIQADPTAEENDGWSDLMMTATLICSGDSVDVSSVSDELGFFNIVDGTYDANAGYTYDNKFIVASFAFQITGSGPIQFALQDPNGNDLASTAFFAKKHEDPNDPEKLTLDLEYATTYAPNGNYPGSMKMTFMGKNEHRGEEPTTTTYTVTFLNKDGEQISSTVYDEGEDVTIPPLPQNTYDNTNHYTYAWDKTPSATATADATYQVVETSETHKYGEGVIDPAATCTTDGLKTFTCTVCGKQYTEVVKATGHSLSDWTVAEAEVPATCTTPGKTAVEKRTCSKCNYFETRGGTEIPAAGHSLSDWTVVEEAVPATCKDGKTAVEKRTCANCNYFETRGGEVIPATGEHVFSDWTVAEAEVPATCTTPGKTAVEKRTCSKCNIVDTRGGTEIPAAGHSLSDWTVAEAEVPATCTTPGKTAVEKRTCANCNYFETRGGTEIPAAGHSLSDWTEAEAAVAPTKKDDGKTAVEKRTCANCNYFETRGGEVIPALGVDVFVTKTDLAEITGLEADKANHMAYGATYTVTAKPVEGAKFIGWEIDGNIVSREATYTATAFANITITPVLEDTQASTITVTFYDKYGNTVKQYPDMAVADYKAAIAADYDNIVAPTYPSYKFESWDKTKDEILNLEASTTIWANYTEVEETEVPKYTVTTNAEIILPDGIENGSIPYDTKVTVRDTAAHAWKVGETIVAYGTEYSFYIGSDITIEPVESPVVEKASTTVIGANLVAGSDYKFNIVATRNVPDGYILTDYGFVYGKNLTDAELDLDLVGTTALSGATIKAVHAGTRNTESNEFAFNYGIKNKNAPITAKSFIVVTKDGETEIIYSDRFAKGYNE